MEIILTLGSFDQMQKNFEMTARCDKCKATFKGKEIELKSFGENLTMANPMLSFKFFQEPDTFKSVWDTNLLPKDKNFYTLHCPKCHQVHLFGMDVV